MLKVLVKKKGKGMSQVGGRTTVGVLKQFGAGIYSLMSFTSLMYFGTKPNSMSLGLATVK